MPEEPKRWDLARLELDLKVAVDRFREVRMQEPLEAYLEAFDRYRAAVEDLLEMTVDLSQLGKLAIEVVSEPALLEALRYLAGPPVSADDLRVLTESSLAPSKLRRDPEASRRVVETVLMGLDRNRFPWVAEDREPTENERAAAAMASAALIASRRVMTDRAGEANQAQEREVADALVDAGMARVDARSIRALDEAPARGEFCGESLLGRRKADLVVRLWDGRAMPIECKVSNSSLNSIKRVNNDAAVKAGIWLDDFGKLQVVPAAVLAGVYKQAHLLSAQDRGLAIFWSHDLGELAGFVGRTRPSG